MLKLFHPVTEDDLNARNQLLQLALRETETAFPIEAEYPLVLSNSGKQFSYCFRENETILAHANLFPRETNTGDKLGLVGNVATHPDFQGKGVMRKLMEALELEAINQGLAELILWSDLTEFYQKLGFSSAGKERRYSVSFGSRQPLPTHCQLVDVSNLELSDCQNLMVLRCPTKSTVVRSAQEMSQLLHIPACWLFLQFDARDDVIGYAILGKGYDMVGVIHEWGGIFCPQRVMEITGIPNCLILAPYVLPQKADLWLQDRTETLEIHPMALHKSLHGEPLSIDDLFIWGLDSI